jgi:hypothetical protein
MIVVSAIMPRPPCGIDCRKDDLSDNLMSSETMRARFSDTESLLTKGGLRSSAASSIAKVDVCCAPEPPVEAFGADRGAPLFVRTSPRVRLNEPSWPSPSRPQRSTPCERSGMRRRLPGGGITSGLGSAPSLSGWLIPHLPGGVDAKILASSSSARSGRKKFTLSSEWMNE